MDKIVKAYSIDDRTNKTDKEDVVISRVGYSEVIKAF